MSDPFGRSVESEEVNSLLQNLIQSSFSHAPFSPHAPHIGPGATSEAFGFADPPHLLIPDARPYEFDDFDSDFKAFFSPHAPHIGLGAMSAGFGFATDPDHEFMPDARAYDFDEFDSDFKGAEVTEGPSDSAPRRSSKRARAAEVHNMSEKRRRSRINEKMKALQKLIPNSNKTDKASMLDEAIEYLKQLQLQVQMLSMRNGVSLYPYCSPVTEPGISTVGQEPLITSNNDTPHHYPQSNQPNLFFPITGVADSKASFGLETPIGQHFQTLNHLASSKDICQVSQLHLEMKCSGKNSSSGVSS